MTYTLAPPLQRKGKRHTALTMGSGWYRQLFFAAVVAAFALAGLGACIWGDGAVLLVGLVVIALGGLALAVFLSPWFEQEWPLDGKDGWLVAGCLLMTSGVPVAATGLILRTPL